MAASISGERQGLSWAGIFAGPFAWAVSFQTNYALVPWQRANKINLVPWLSAAGVVVALLGGFLSYRALTTPGHGTEPPATERTRRFLAGVGLGIAILAAMIMILQGAAGLVFDGCER